MAHMNRYRDYDPENLEGFKEPKFMTTGEALQRVWELARVKRLEEIASMSMSGSTQDDIALDVIEDFITNNFEDEDDTL